MHNCIYMKKKMALINNYNMMQSVAILYYKQNDSILVLLYNFVFILKKYKKNIAINT